MGTTGTAGVGGGGRNTRRAAGAAIAAGLSAVVAMLLAASPASALPSWSVVSTYGTGAGPEEVATIPDIEGNGMDGWAVSNFSASTASIGFSNGDGSFDTATKGTGGQPVGIAAGNFDPDPYATGFITANQSGSVTAVYAFDAGLNYVIDSSTAATGAGVNPTGIATGDFNQDGNVDAAVTNLFADTVSVMIGDGSGGFTSTTAFPTGAGPNSIAVADFNGDSHLDLATGDNSGLSASILLGNGAGSFGAPISTPQRVEDAYSIEAGEFTGDSDRDLVVGVDSGVVLLAGHGDGRFGAPVAIDTGPSQGMVAVTDVDADGRDDVLLAYRGTSQVKALIGNGNGTFESPVSVNAGVGDAEDLATADYRGNGSRDLAVLDGNANQLKILFGRPGVALPADVQFGPQGVNSPSGSQAVTVRNDGAAALSITSVGVSGSESGDFAVQSESCTGGSVPRGGTCQIDLTFTPSGLGQREAQLVLTDSAPGGQQLVPLAGTGVNDGPDPTATTGPVTGTTPTGTTMTGTVDPRGSDTDYHFEYGPTTAYGSVSGTGQAGDGSQPVPVSIGVGGLTPGQTYHYRLVATNANGSAFGQDSIFVAADTPTAVTGSASGVTSTAADLAGTVDPKGQRTTWWIAYGPSGGQLNGSTDPQIIPSGSGGIPVSAHVTGLDPLGDYQFQVVALSLAGRSSGLRVAFKTPASPPVAATGAATQVLPTGANLHAEVNPNGAETHYAFDYGLTDAYGASTSSRSAGSGRVAEPVSRSVAGLEPNRTYHYRVRATSSSGSATGSDQTFTTAAPPEALTGDPDAVGVHSGVLTGSVDPRNLNTSYRFEWGTTASYGNSTPVRPAGAGSGALPVSEALSGLASSTTYHYRLVAEGSDGSVGFGADRTLTTQADPAPPPLPQPTALTLAPSRRGPARVVVAGSVAPNGLQTDWFFQFGRTTAYGRTTSTFSLPAVAGPLPVQGVLKGLKPGRAFHYRLVAVNGGGTSTGPDRVVRTKPKGKRK